MNKSSLTITFIFFYVNFLLAQGEVIDISKEWELSRESRYFFDTPQFENQLNYYPSFGIQPTYKFKWNEGYENFIFSIYFNFDRDKNRTYWDLREMYYQKTKNNWELNIGFKKVFWGVTKSCHLVDIVNQTDALKSFDGEEKLGQPMVQFSWVLSRFGSIDIFYLPYHRKRGFPGEKGRFRFNNIIDSDDIKYESGKGEFNTDFAARWNHYFGAFGIGLSYFNGNGREPYFKFDEKNITQAYYPLINQYGIDLQITAGALLLKFESIYRTAKEQQFLAMNGGFEFTFSNVDNNGLDLGVLAEYLYDERGDWAVSGLQDDIFYGSKLAFNDSQNTSILAGGIYDFQTSTNLFTMEASRRFKNNMLVSLEGRVFSGVSDKELFLLFFKQDSYFKISVSKYY